MATLKAYILSDNILETDLVINKQSGAYINNATVTATLKDSAGNNVAGETWPLTLAYVASSNGKYRATLKDTLTVSKDTKYYAHIDIDGGTDLRRHWETEISYILGT